jgi:hypothetical protein
MNALEDAENIHLTNEVANWNRSNENEKPTDNLDRS